MTGQIHFLAATVALLSGATALVFRKGSPPHRWAGRVYVGSMAVMLATAMLIYRLFDGFGPFHVMALISAVTLFFGVLPLYTRRVGTHWIIRHGMWMSWSYIGLCAAAAAELTTRTMDLDFGATVVLTSLAVVLAGGLILWRTFPGALSRLDLAPRQPSERD